MITLQPMYAPVYHRRASLGQAPTPLPPSPPQMPMGPTTPVGGSLLNTLKWSVIGFGAGAVTGFALGKGLGSKAGAGLDSILGGVAGLVATVIPNLLGTRSN